ncbi:MAG TPA: hypothetical protein VG246_13175 [Acidimicrobiales bacterium]|jgi:hypothetical protein|nr:hypothetical protein [Acidimicrobiales bacterium]
MARTDVMGFVQKFRPDLIKRAVNMRINLESFDAIGQVLSEGMGMHIGREAVRRWFVREGVRLVNEELAKASNGNAAS